MGQFPLDAAAGYDQPMAQFDLYAEVVLPYRSGMPRDVAVNRFNFVTPDSSDRVGEANAIIAALQEFYNTPTTSSGALSFGGYMSNEIDRTKCVIKVYDYADAKPRVPVQTTAMTLQAATSASSLPLMVALCATWVGENPAEDGSTLPLRRRRGRTYLGPWNVSALSTSDTPTTGPVPNTGLITLIRESATRLAGSDVPGAGGSGLVIISDRAKTIVPGHPGTGTPLTPTASVVMGGWVDNAWDCQRRRDTDPTARSSWGSTT